MKKVSSKIRNIFIAGLIIIGPLGFTVIVLKWMFNFFDGFLKPYLKEYISWYFPGMGILFTIIAVYIIGLLASNLIGKKIIKLIEKLLFRLPIVKVVYSTTKGIFQAFSVQGKGSFKKVIFFQYPRKGLWTLALVTGSTTGANGEEYYSIFFPSTPNPTTGYLLFVNKNEAIESHLSIEEGMKILLSGGMVLPRKISIGKLPPK
ncbi:MAG: DUF502 domain-containing protein [Candidatus Aminicenantaceae bacterium]